MRRPADRDQGASFTEYLALGVLAALVITGLIASGLPAHLTNAARTTICRIPGQCHRTTAGTNRPGTDRPGTDRPGTDRPGTDRPGTDRPGTGTPGTGTPGTNQPGSEHPEPDRRGLDPSGAPHDPSAGNPETRAGTWYTSWHTFAADTKDFFAGAASAGLDELKGLGETARLFPCWGFGLCSPHDDQTIRWIGDHPGQVADALWHSATDPCRKVGENPTNTTQQGRCLISTITWIAPLKGIGKLGRLAELGGLGKFARAAADAERAAHAADEAARSGDLAGARAAAARARASADRARRGPGDRSKAARRADSAAKRAENAAGGARMQMPVSKWKYLFGKANPANPHNYRRSLGTERQLRKVGVYDDQEGRRMLGEHFKETLWDDTNVKETWSAHGQTFETRDSLFSGPGGLLHLEVTWEVMPDGHLRFITVIAKGK